jgi:hypothetical protein
MPGVQTEYFAAAGGLDLVTPQIEIKPGSVLGAINYEASNIRGYDRVGGYERYDGRPRPSDASYTVLPASAGIASDVVAGDIISGQTSSATGVVIYVEPARKWMAVTKVSGTFAVGENLRKAGVTKAVMTATMPGITQGMDADFVALAAAVYRADIGVVPGSGPVRGVWLYKDVLYAFRNNAGGTAGVMHRATASGWQAVALGEEVSFTNANANVIEGRTLTQGAVTATIMRVVVQTGSLQSGTNSGRLIIANRSGGNFASGAATTTLSGSLTLSGVQVAITLPAGGKYRFRNYNFTGSADTFRMYGTSGVGRAFEFDGTTFVPIATGMLNDTPSFVECFKNHLFLGFRGSVQHSSVGEPYRWSAVLGAGEIAVGDAVSGFAVVPGFETGGALMIFTRNALFTLYGNSSADWRLVVTSDAVGALPDTVQLVASPVFLDTTGVAAATPTQSFGNFDAPMISDKVRPLIESLIGYAGESVAIRKKGQYKLFFTNRTGLTFTFAGGRMVGVLPFTFGHDVNCTCSGDMGLEEVAFFGGADGYVYQLNRGRSYDGAEIEYAIRFAFNHSRGPKTVKRYRRAFIDVKTASPGTFRVGYELSYASDDKDISPAATYEVPGFGGRWDEMAWDAFYWDGPEFVSLPLSLDGTGENISYLIAGKSAKELPHSIHGITTHFTPRRSART